jgi:hypothetical protein
MPLREQRHSGQMRAGGEAGQIDAPGVATEVLCMARGPGDGAANLLDHRHQIAIVLVHRDEVRDDVMRAGVHQHFGGKGVFGRRALVPGPTVNVNVDRRIRPPGGIDFEPLDGGRAVIEAFRLAEARAHRIAVGRITPGDLQQVRRVF